MEPKAKKQVDKLPNRPSELIRVALADLQKCVDQGITIDMSWWYHRDDAGCAVCLAGAVMAQTLDEQSLHSYGPAVTGYPLATQNKLFALDYFRIGNVSEGLRVMRIKTLDMKQQVKNRTVVQYAADPEKFVFAMKLLAGQLEEAGC